MIRLIILSIVLGTLSGIQQVSSQEDEETVESIIYDFKDPQLDFRVTCLDTNSGHGVPTLTKLGDDCQLVKIFNQTEADLMEYEKLHQLAKHCACQLMGMRDLWTQTFDSDPSTRRLAFTVKRVIEEQNDHHHPPYLWSDIDVTVYQISIYTATKDYFDQQSFNKSKLLRPALRRELDKDEMWTLIKKFCWKIARDTSSLYRYIENLNRIDPAVFINLVTSIEHIDLVYSASKACKLLVLPKLNDYKLRPINSDYIPVYPSSLTNQPENSNAVTNDLDLMLNDASALLLKCSNWQTTTRTPKELAIECPMMVSEKVPTDWLLEHPTSIDRSQHAVRCGCQLLLHNATWATILRDPNVQIMSKTVTNYLNRNQVPDFSNTPIWSIYGWFENIMSSLTKNRKQIIKEVIKTKSNDQDPKLAENPLNDEALELLRRGCNYIVFNYNKGSKDSIELKLIKYLGNLQHISQDSMFVFHLTLQDPNLFKLYALSKMCQPILY